MEPDDEIRRNGARKRENLDFEPGGEDFEIRGAETELEEGKGSALLGRFAIVDLRIETSTLSLVRRFPVPPQTGDTHLISFLAGIFAIF